MKKKKRKSKGSVLAINVHYGINDNDSINDSVANESTSYFTNINGKSVYKQGTLRTLNTLKTQNNKIFNSNNSKEEDNDSNYDS